MPDDAPPRPAGRCGRCIALFLAVTVVTLAADLGIKSWTFAHVAGKPVVLDKGHSDDPFFWEAYPHEATTLIPGVLSLKLTTNTGAIFGLAKNKRWLLVLVSVVAIGAIGRVFYTSDRKAWLFHVCLGLILSGALGNLYDRIVFGAVRDMFWMLPGVKLPWGWNWPNGSDDAYPWIFNLADVALLAGVAILIGMVIFGPKHDRPLPEQTGGSSRG
ncbi:MAG: hypothetical protein GC164_11320 [Phycisphaera sp.]|nr:hypothetical protein [Phycisphaera sp.]